MPPGVVVDLRSTSAVHVFVFSTHGVIVMDMRYPFHEDIDYIVDREFTLLGVMTLDELNAMNAQCVYEWRLEA
jgi:hypothetical protein